MAHMISMLANRYPHKLLPPHPSARNMLRLQWVVSGMIASKGLKMTTTSRRIKLRNVQLALLCLFTSASLPVQAQAQVPVFVISRQESTIKFYVKASIDLRGTFDKWDATLTFASPDVTTGVLRVTVQAASVDTGSSIENSTLKTADFFNVEQQPLITFVSKTITQTGPDSFQVAGDFTIRGVTRPKVLTLMNFDKQVRQS
jgi:polyisoprenoid-binding protein YceI